MLDARAHENGAVPCRGMGETNEMTSTLLVDAPGGTPGGDEAVRSAIGIIDEALSTLLQRELVSADEVTDVLLDVRSVLLAATA